LNASLIDKLWRQGCCRGKAVILEESKGCPKAPKNKIWVTQEIYAKRTALGGMLLANSSSARRYP